MSPAREDNASARAAEGRERRDEMRAVYTTHHPKLMAFVARRVEGKPEAEDLCQDVWRLFFSRYDHYVEFYDEPVKVLYAIAKCRIAELWQRRGRAREVPFEGEDVTLLIHAIAPDLPTGIERRVDIGRALACLPARQREALHFHYIDSLTIAETAVLMGIGSNGVKKLLKKALERLRDTAVLSAYRPEGTGEGVYK
ncbi:RNA polymerase sigma factor [Streptomyces cyaneochromogenes]|uniref:RNA polymerase sigma factor n=1 Tax=Streptomyces cyaneochromogenes TaxID=2496836 RepID=A0A3S9M1X6_9ACTN|nr:RNA polymerase sigma factor [Streptomyces cyaneochromogenes]AZQ33228.1 RNA polymerase sigma factor [Streptomyces cyaneochromogenes]